MCGVTALSTREKLLAAARAEFAEHGIAGARVERIATQAGVNKERLYSNFGSKEKLFHAVSDPIPSAPASIAAQVVPTSPPSVSARRGPWPPRPSAVQPTGWLAPYAVGSSRKTRISRCSARSAYLS